MRFACGDFGHRFSLNGLDFFASVMKGNKIIKLVAVCILCIAIVWMIALIIQ